MCGKREPGHAEIYVGEANFGGGDIDGADKEWVCDTGSDYHLSGDNSMFEKLEQIPSDFYVRQIKGKVAVNPFSKSTHLNDKGRHCS